MAGKLPESCRSSAFWPGGVRESLAVVPVTGAWWPGLSRKAGVEPRGRGPKCYARISISLCLSSGEMASTATGEVAGAGLDVLVLDDQGRIMTDSQFVER